MDITGRKLAEAELRKSEERFKMIASSTPDHLLIQDRELRYTLVVNPQLNLKEEDMIGKTDHDFLTKEDADKLTAIKRRVLNTGESVRMEAPLIDSTGAFQYFEGSYVPTFDERKQVTGLIGYFRNVTERKVREKEQERFNRTLQALNKSNEAMMRAMDENEYMEEVCKIIVEDCGHKMVWIGFAQEDEGKTVRPVAYNGFEEGYLDALKITWADAERGRGPTGTAIRTIKPSSCRNMLTDPHFKPWREEAIKRGYASSISLPLVDGNKAFGALTIYSKEPDPFTEDEVNLLTELANDLSYGIMAIRIRAARMKAEEALYESKSQLDLALQSAHTGMWYWDIINKKRYFDNQVCNLLGIDPATFTGTDDEFFRAVHRDDRATIRAALLRTIEHNVPYEVEYRVVWPDGSIHYISARGMLVRNNVDRPVRINGIIWDITERQQREDQLAKQAAELQERTVQLEEINKELESFSYSVSHDLRSPLRAIDGYSRMILKREGDKFDEETTRKFNTIRLNVQQMGQLIDGLLNLSRLGKQELAIVTLDMTALVGDTWNELQVINPDRVIELTVSSMPNAYGDRILIKQVYLNLLDNAIKYTKHCAPAKIEAGGYTKDKEHVYYIKDNGAGFDMAYYDKLFGIFQRLHNTDDFEGTGIGLAIVQRIIHKHGGKVWAEGETEKGATFYFTLPLTHT
jgi:PAS domain S-box-containing protein